MTENTYAVVLAAGKGSRMKSDLPKVLSQLAGKALVLHVLEKIVAANIKKIIIVVGYKKEQVQECIDSWAAQKPGLEIRYAVQAEQNGTGHAVMMAEDQVQERDGMVAVLLGDVPMIKSGTILKSIEDTAEKKAAATVVSMKLPDPSGYGRIIRSESEELLAIREEKDASEAEKKVNEVNSGIFIFQSGSLFEALNRIGNDNAQGEYYITDTIEVLRSMNKKVNAYLSDDADQFRGINSPEQLAELNRIAG